MLPKIYADFHDLDDENRIRLNKVGTRRDLQRLGVHLTEGMVLTFYMDDADGHGNADDIMVDGTAHFSVPDNCWVGAVDWDTVYHASEQANRDNANSKLNKRATKNA